MPPDPFVVTSVSASGEYVATFRTEHQLTMLVNPLGSGTVTPATGRHTAGSTVPITASAAGANQFTIWTGAGAGAYDGTSNPIAVIVNNPITQTANFNAPQLTINPSAQAVRNFFFVHQFLVGNRSTDSARTLQATLTGPSGTYDQSLDGVTAVSGEQINYTPPSVLPSGNNTRSVILTVTESGSNGKSVAAVLTLRQGDDPTRFIGLDNASSVFPGASNSAGRFSFQFEDFNGYPDIAWTQHVFSRSPQIDLSNACDVLYSSTLDILYLGSSGELVGN
jgi:hypothetical protein